MKRLSDRIDFRYLPGYRAMGGRSIASTLPTTDSVITTPGSTLHPFFANLLPEESRRRRLAARLKVTDDDEVSLLLAIGNDVIGDVQIVPRGTQPRDLAPSIRVYGNRSDRRFTSLLQDNFFDPIGIPGRQPKASSTRTDVVAIADTHGIIKVSSSETPASVLNEAFILEKAQDAGLQTPKFVVVEDEDGRSALFVQRFDRVISHERVIRLECEDACQVLGIGVIVEGNELDRRSVPTRKIDKYRPTAEQVITALADACEQPYKTRLELFRRFTFAWLVGDADLHAKNVSILRRQDGAVHLAPHYDMNTMLIHRRLTSDMALPMCVDKDFNPGLVAKQYLTGFSRKRLVRFADNIQIDGSEAETIIDEVHSATSSISTDRRFLEIVSMSARFGGQSQNKIQRLLDLRHSLTARPEATRTLRPNSRYSTGLDH